MSTSHPPPKGVLGSQDGFLYSLPREEGCLRYQEKSAKPTLAAQTEWSIAIHQDHWGCAFPTHISQARPQEVPSSTAAPQQLSSEARPRPKRPPPESNDG